jgi:indole-3-glycerol phosphate synthase
MTATTAANVLDAIVGATRRIIAARSEREPRAALEARALVRQPQGARFREALRDATRLNVIAECKRRSPSRGVLRADYDPASIAMAYERAGAAAVSVLTEPTFFDGTLDHLAAVRQAVRVPLLRKDFIVDSYQLLEARANGADAVLLIVAALTDDRLATLHAEAHALGLAALVEVHDVDEIERALAVGAEIVGVNSRNLRTLDVDREAALRAIPKIPSPVVAVCESGLKHQEDLLRWRGLGYKAFLVGERLMTSADPEAALRELVTTGAPQP